MRVPHLYNPWSILNFIENNGVTKMYWANTSDNELIKTLLGRISSTLQKDLEQLLTGTTSTQQISEGLIPT